MIEVVEEPQTAVIKSVTAPDFSRFVGESEAMKSVYKTVGRLLDNDSTVLVLGESGTGKELIAKAIHENSVRRDKPMITVNCGAIPEELLESELFGHEKGSFTGAIRTRIGKFELADKGAIFLDEIGDMSPTLQVKILRILQEKRFERVGGAKTIEVDTRVITATNIDLEKAIEAGRFREDLYYRLNVIPIELPPLRDRGGDITLLINHFVRHFNKTKSRMVTGVSAEAMACLKSYNWPGNVRELEHMMERLIVLKGEGLLEKHDLPAKLRQIKPKEDEQLYRDMMLVGEPEELAEQGIITAPKAEPVLAAQASNVTVIRSDAQIAPVNGAGHSDPRENLDVSQEAAEANVALAAGFDEPLDVPANNDSFHQPVLPDEGINLKEAVDKYETTLILAALDRCGWVKNKAAALLGLNRTTLVEKLKKKNLLNGLVEEGAA
ncbi:MAG: sigma-54-dependent Fis family transcriptional regulator [Nitrospinae bacterium]|nr:sigma-54-dependent Fis family transcriptional regulator [Nitrospinota bacterium]